MPLVVIVEAKYAMRFKVQSVKLSSKRERKERRKSLRDLYVSSQLPRILSSFRPIPQLSNYQVPLPLSFLFSDCNHLILSHLKVTRSNSLKVEVRGLRDDLRVYRGLERWIEGWGEVWEGLVGGERKGEFEREGSVGLREVGKRAY